MTTKRLLWTGAGFVLLAVVTATITFVVQIAAIVAAIFFGVVLNAPAIADGAKIFTQVNVPRVLSAGLQIAIFLLVVAVLCIGEVLRRRLVQFTNQQIGSDDESFQSSAS